MTDILQPIFLNAFMEWKFVYMRSSLILISQKLIFMVQL